MIQTNPPPPLSQNGTSSLLSLSAACISDVGQVRENNEDNFYLGLEDGIFIVADGMGGHQSGEIASRIVIESLPQILLSGLKQALAEGAKVDYKALIRGAVIELNELVGKKAQVDLGLSGMGATLALAWVTDARGTVYLANVGDSRVYYQRKRTLNQLTRDHSIVALLLLQGEITPEEAPTHPARGRLFRYIGMDREALPEVHRIRLSPDEMLLLCSDGLTDMLSDFRLQAIIGEQADLLPACQMLVDTANQQGGKDNITAMLVRWEE